MNILFLNCGRRVELIQAFKASGLYGTIFGSDIDHHAPALSFVDHVLDVSLDYSTLESVCSKKNIDLVIPTIDPDLMRLRSSKAPVLISGDECIIICNNKMVTKAKAAELGIPVPETRDPETCDLPYFKKPISGSAGEGVRVIQHKEGKQEGYMYEEVLSGTEVTVDIMMDLDSMAICAVARERLRVRGGEVQKSVVRRDSQLEGWAINLAQSLRCKGPVTVQFMDRKFLEINARMGGGLPLTIEAGGLWPTWIYQIITGIPPSIPTIQDGMVMSRYDQSVFTASKKAYIFDLDDTLYLEQDYAFAGFHAVAERVYDDLGLDVEGTLRLLYLNGVRERIFNEVLPEADEEYIRELVCIYRECSSPLQPCVDIEVLSDLKHDGHQIGLVTNNKNFSKLDRLDLDNLFDAVALDSGKPLSRGFEYVLGKLGVDASNAVYIGDNPTVDFEGAMALGIKCIRIKRHMSLHYHVDTPEGIQTIKSLRELL